MKKVKRIRLIPFFLGALLGTVVGNCQVKLNPITAAKDVAVVEIECGKVRGYIHNDIFTYKGIPYAQAERFMPPSKPTPWKDVRSATSYGPNCPTDPTSSTQSDEFEFAFQHNWELYNENCQTLNIWTPQIGNSKKRPVMIWLHGGAFTFGSSTELPSFDGESLSRKGDLVIVSLNHRLNVLGFLDLSAYGDKFKSSPNAGMLDIVAALQWVKQNIRQFGGDPNNVTIFGQSGGGAKVTTLMSAPLAKGLFHKAIVQSGSYLDMFIEGSIAKRVAAILLTELQLQPSQVDSLQKIPYDQLNAAGKKAVIKLISELKAEGKNAGSIGFWGPILDGVFLPFQIYDSAALEISKNIPLLVGTNKNEFNVFQPALRNLTMEQVNSNLEKQFGTKVQAYKDAVKKAYPETAAPSEYVNVDFFFRIGALRQAEQKNMFGTAPVYMYLFTWQSPVNDGIYKAMHCMELPFVFNNIQRCEEMTGGGKEAYTLADKMSSFWINFARTGNPNGNGLPNWPTYTQQNGATIIFDKQIIVRNHPDKELLSIAAQKL